MTEATTFAKLAAMDCKEHIEKKGKFSYLSWPWAVRKLRETAPSATWAVLRFDGLPYLKTDCGVFVEVAVTVDGITLSQIHPVLNANNKPIASPTAFDINTSIQRCLVKAIALHGLGLYIYAGEDLPNPEEREPGQDDEERPGITTAYATPNTAKQVAVDAFESYSDEDKDFLRTHARELQRIFEDKGDMYGYVEHQFFDTEQKLALWSLLDSKVRSEFKRQQLKRAANPVAAAA